MLWPLILLQIKDVLKYDPLWLSNLLTKLVSKIYSSIMMLFDFWVQNVLLEICFILYSRLSLVLWPQMSSTSQYIPGLFKLLTWNVYTIVLCESTIEATAHNGCVSYGTATTFAYYMQHENYDIYFAGIPGYTGMGKVDIVHSDFVRRHVISRCGIDHILWTGCVFPGQLQIGPVEL